jgi:hypothetical protein
MSWMSRSRFGGLVALSLIAVACGCDGAGSAPTADSSTTESAVSGTVTVNGKLASEGKVTFDPANIQRKMAKATTVDIGKDGTYKLTTLVGDNRVIVDTPEIRKDSAALANGETSHKVAAGGETFNIEFPAKTP